MAENNKDKAVSERLYPMLLMVREELSRLSLQVKALRNEIKGVNSESDKV